MNILNNCWLSDDVIDHAQMLIQHHFPQINGLYASAAAFTLDPLNPDDDRLFLQIINRSTPTQLSQMADYYRTAGSHWLVLSNFKTEFPGTLIGYDSLYKPASDFTKDLAEHLLSNYGPPHSLKFRRVQQQTDKFSCGLFAIAFAFSIAHGEDPGLVTYDVSQMGRWLIRCLEDQEVRLFPTI